MSCTNCIQTTASITGFIPNNCTSTNPCFLDAGCVVYTGPALSCSGIVTNDNLATMLQKIDPLLCAATGDYSTYNTFCLAPISTQKQFVESISNFVCTLQTNFTTFTGTTFPAYQASVASQFTAITSPGLTCASASINSGMTLSQVYAAYCTKFTAIDAALNPSAANWNSCYVVSPLPTTIVAGFNVLISQICDLQTQIDNSATLPTFNNVGTCLASPGTTDSLVDTVTKIRTRLCLTGTLDTTTLTWGCVTQPSGAQNLQDSLQNILTEISTIADATPFQWSGDFTVTNVDNGNPCAGKHIALATPSAQDRFVASNNLDNSPGTLADKVTAGTNVTLDFVTTPGQMIINSSAGSSSTFQVKVNNTDPSPDYLGAKIAAGAAVNGTQVIPTIDTVAHQVVLGLSIDPVVLFTALLNALDEDSGLSTLFCTKVSNCPSPCSAPSNVIVTFLSGTTTTTTSTTSTTSTTTTTTTTHTTTTTSTTTTTTTT